MAKYRVTLADGREIHAYANDEAGALFQINHHEAMRIVIATKREKVMGTGPGQEPYPSMALSAVKIKD